MGETSGLRASVIVVSFNEARLIRDCLGSVFDQDIERTEYEVIVVDNASTDETVEIIHREFPDVVVISSPINLGYPAGMNLGLQSARSGRIVMLSTDTVVPRGWLSALLAPMDDDPSVKVTHAAMVIPGDPGYGDGLAARRTPAHAAYHDLSRLGLVEPHWVSTSAAPIPTLHVAGASAAFERAILPELGNYMMDGDFFLDCDEIDFGLRVNSLGYKVLAVPAAAYYHRHPFNTKMTLNRRMAARLIRLERNKALAFYKNLHTTEWLACLPILLFGGALKPLVYAERFSIPQLIFGTIGLEVFVWLGFVTALVGYFGKFAEKRRVSLGNRRQPAFWFFEQLLARPALDHSNA
jgi:GT2 family glycosyltransferase